MEQSAIIYPAAALVAWTMAVALLLVAIRIRLVSTRQMSPAYFKIYRGGKSPGYHTRLEQHYTNLFEFPILFYALVATLLASDMVTETFITLSWVYVGLRFLHTIIHTTYNHILHRLFVFATSCFVVVYMWIKLALSL